MNANNTVSQISPLQVQEEVKRNTRSIIRNVDITNPIENRVGTTDTGKHL